jgi:hypothetical protein
MYSITKYTYKQAEKLGVKVKPSKNTSKKLNVYKDDKKIASIGAYGMSNFPTYTKTHGHTYAKKRRRLYKIRHEKDRHVKWSRGWLSDKLLW